MESIIDDLLFFFKHVPWILPTGDRMQDLTFDLVLSEGSHDLNLWTSVSGS